MKRFLTKPVVAFLAIFCFWNTPAKAQVCNPPQSLSHTTVSGEDYSVSLSWEKPENSIGTKSMTSGMICGTTLIGEEALITKTLVNSTDKYTVLNTDLLNIRCMEFFNDKIYAVEAHPCSSCGGEIFDQYNVGILDSVTGQFDIMIGAIEQDIISLAWNPKNNKAYVALNTPDFNSDTRFGILNFNTGTYEPISDDWSHVTVIAIDNDGICYGINYNKLFGTISLENGTFTPITTLPVNMEAVCQNIEIDRETNELYWAARLDGTSCALYKIHKTTGNLTLIGHFPEGERFLMQSFSILSKIIPVKYHVYRDEQKLTFDPILSRNFTDTNIEKSGNYTYCVTAVYTLPNCESEKICTSVIVQPGLCENSEPIPFSQGFEQKDFPPFCWKNKSDYIASSGSPAVWKQTSRSQVNTFPVCNPHSGTGMLLYDCSRFAENYNGLLVSPKLNINDDIHKLTFWMYRDAENQLSDHVNVYISETSQISESTPMLTVHRYAELSPSVPAAGWHAYSCYFNATGMEQCRIIFEGVSAHGNNIYIDDIQIVKCVECEPVFNIKAEGNAAESSILVSWQYDTPDMSFELYKNGTFLARTSEKTYLDKAVADDWVTYCVIPAGDCCEMQEICVSGNIWNTGIQEDLHGLIRCFPNPAQTKLTVSGENISQVDILNGLGQLLESLSGNQNLQEINVENYPQGVYFLRIRARQRLVTQRIVIVR